jgi:hypothetical protein
LEKKELEIVLKTLTKGFGIEDPEPADIEDVLR